MQADALLEKIENNGATAAVIGLGYVGLPLARTIIKKGLPVIGLDTDAEKIRQLKEGTSYIDAVTDEFIDRAVRDEKLIPVADPEALERADVLLICVPTPLDENREPNTGYIEKTARDVRDHLQDDQLVILESTTYPGTTEDLLVPILEESGLEAGEDFYVAYSPERQDPGNEEYTTDRIPKVVGGIDETSSVLAREFYQQITVGVVSVDSPKEAEASKLLENIYRSVNIALVNELKTIFQDMDVDVWEVIDAASTKPFGYEPFYPGPGLGGHCLPIDPFFLSWKAEQEGREARMIELAGEINTSMPEQIVQKIENTLADRGRSLSDANALLLGAAYKKDVDDLRGSPALKLFQLLEERGAEVDYHDPHIPEIKDTRNYPGEKTSIHGYPESLQNYDFLLVTTAHSFYNPEDLVEYGKLIFDARNLMGKMGKNQNDIYFV